MALYLKSNVVVNDPDGRFEYNTPLGATTRELFIYYYALRDKGYSLTQAEFNALDSYQRGLTAIGKWNDIKEFAPLIGNTVEQVAIKMKYKNAQSCAKIGDITNDYVDGKGLYFETRPNELANALSMLYTNQDVVDESGGGIISYFKRTNNPEHATELLTILGSKGGIREVFQNPTDIWNYYLNSNARTNGLGVGPYVYASKFIIESNNIKQRRVYKDGILSSFTDTSVPMTELINPGFSHLIGASNGTAANLERAVSGFEGVIRLMIIHNGQFTDSEMATVSDLTSTLITGLGKTIV
jgi:hypothetical protein